MKGLERITSVRLAEALAQTSQISNEQISDALYKQDNTGIPFVEILVDQGAIAEWDLAKIVVQHYQLPFLSIKGSEPSKDAVASLPEDFLFENRVVPIELFGDVLTLTMPILIPFKVLEQAGHLAKKRIFPLVGLFSENLETLFELFPEHSRESEEARKKKLLHEETGESEWENIFDMGDQEVLKGLGD
jgi:MshEN domain